MKRTVITFSLVVIFSFFAIATPSFSVHIGGDFFNYEDNFLDLGLSYLRPVGQDMEFYLSAHFGVLTNEVDGEIEADFFYPIDSGLHFLFPFTNIVTGLFGVGITPQFYIADETRFYLGPSVKAGFRVKIHPLMQWMAEVQQDLVIGAPKWINTGTRLYTGIIFTFE